MISDSNYKPIKMSSKFLNEGKRTKEEKSKKIKLKKKGILPKIETQTLEFLKENPKWNGKNVIGKYEKKKKLKFKN